MKHGAPWIIKSLFTAEDRDRVGPGAVAVRVETRRCNIASCLVKTIAAKVDSKLLRHTRISFPRTDISWAVVARYARSRPGRSPRSWRCIIVVRDRLSAELAAQTVAFIAMLIARVLNFGWKKKKIFARTRALHFAGQICRNAGSVSKFSIYQLVERLTQRRRRYRAGALSPVCSSFSLNLYVDRRKKGTKVGRGRARCLSTATVSAIRSTFTLTFILVVILDVRFARLGEYISILAKIVIAR